MEMRDKSSISMPFLVLCFRVVFVLCLCCVVFVLHLCLGEGKEDECAS